MSDFAIRRLDPYIAITEQKIVYNNQIILKYLCDEFTRMKCQGYTETTNKNEIPQSTSFYCDYNLGILTFNPSENGKFVQLDFFATAEKIITGGTVVLTDEDNKFTYDNVESALAELYDIAIQLKLIFQEPVEKQEDIETTYPNPEKFWTVQTTSDGKWYMYNGTEWKYFYQIELNQMETKLNKNGDTMTDDLNMITDKGIVFGGRFKIKLNGDLNSLDIETL